MSIINSNQYSRLKSVYYVDGHLAIFENNKWISVTSEEIVPGTKGDKGDQGPQGPQGPRGPQGPQGPRGYQGVRGERGPKGDPGTAIALQGSVDDIAELDLIEDPVIADCYICTADAHAYMYNGELWVDCGRIRGPQGEKGEKGEKGDIGPAFTYEDFTGEQLEALIGPQGPQGPRGPQGLQGDDLRFEDLTEEQKAELRGPKGDALKFDDLSLEQIEMIKGPKGEKGEKGEKGAAGPKGMKGEPGPQGPQGPIGLQGERGEAFKYEHFTEEQLMALVGPMGPEGPQGIQGPQGEMGPEGPQGIQGPEGPQGIQGEKGEKGDQGEMGPQGEVGPQGPMGAQGLQGEKGEAFKYEDFTEEQLEALRGPQGPQGPAGSDGTSVRIMGSVANVDELNQINGESVGDGYIAEDNGHLYVFNGVDSFVDAGEIRGPQGIQGPQGEKGDQGEKGEKGDQGEMGPQGPQGEIGPQGLQGEKGDKGEKGDQGEMGPQGPQGLEGPMGPQGLQGPQGEKGDQGEMGPQGPMGPQGEKGEVGPQGPMGPEGPQGIQGPQGEAGYTPIKGIDYFTQEELDELKYDDSNLRELIDEQKPYLADVAAYPTSKFLFACGQPMTVEPNTNFKYNANYPEDAVAFVYRWNDGFECIMVEKEEAAKVYLVGGYGNDHVNVKRAIPQTNMVVRNVKIKGVVGGSYFEGMVGHVNMLLDNCEFTSIIGGGWCGASLNGVMSRMNIADDIKIVANNCKISSTLFGGSQGNGVADDVYMELNNCEIGWLTAGGSNGMTRNAVVVMNGGSVKVAQSTNRGIVCKARFVLNDGVVEKLYFGGETEDNTVNGLIEDGFVELNGGIVKSFNFGTNEGIELLAENIKGSIMDCVVENGDASMLDKVEKPEEVVNYDDSELRERIEELEFKKHIIENVPEGTLVDYRDNEIRIMCPKDAVFTKQNVGETGNPNMYYMSLKTMAPEGAVAFREGDRGVVLPEVMQLDGKNSKTIWLALASLSGENWIYFGKTSTAAKFIGWDYVIEWLDENGNVIETNCMRINLSNEECHAVSIFSAVKELANMFKFNANGELEITIGGVTKVFVPKQ